MDQELFNRLYQEINPKKEENKEWFLSLLDEEGQRAYEENRLSALMRLLRILYIDPLKEKIKALEQKKQAIASSADYAARDYVDTVNVDRQIVELKNKIDTYKCFFEEPYFARMDLVDDKEGYNSYYIGKKGDEKLEIVDWRAPLAKRYYQKSKLSFSINEYDYKIILRRALQTKNGKFIDFKNEYLSLKDYLTKEEIGGRDEELIFDPFLRGILKERKDESTIRDIIETIQEKQFEMITLPERENFVLQGCAGSGKTMVLLHRLSYLLYNNEELSARDVLVITPSNSFNDFIDELATVLELEKVRTVTMSDYFLSILEKLGVDLSQKINPAILETKEYLQYIYSPAFPQDIQNTLDKVYDSVHGMLSSPECEDIISVILKNCEKQRENYTAIRNSSQRVRRTLLGEIKERAEGGIYFTKPFRDFMNALQTVEEFLGRTLRSEKSENQSYFYKELVTFYKSAGEIVKKNAAVIARARGDLADLRLTVEKEIAEYKRYKYRVGSHEFLTYADSIAVRENLIKEIDKIAPLVEEIGDDCLIFSDFYEVLKGEKNFTSLGKCENFIDLVRFFYKSTVKKAKNKYGVVGKGLVRSDAYSICYLLSLLGEKLPMRYSLVFVDEGQDVSANEYDLLRRINASASFNIFGDLKQNMTSFRGIESWEEVFPFPVHYLRQNYRNTNQIVDFVSRTLDADMQSIGFDGPEVAAVKPYRIPSFFKDITGLKAVITSEERLPLYRKKSYNILRETGKISKTKINLMTVYESKGLEFSAVAVDDSDLSPHEKYIAYTRALMTLGVIEKTGENL